MHRLALAILVVLCLASPAWGANVFVKDAYSGATSTTTVTTFASNVTAGNLIAICIEGVDGASIPTVTTLTDTGTNTYVAVTSVTNATNNRYMYLYYAANIAAGGVPLAVTVVMSASSAVAMSAYEIQGAATTSPIDKFAAQNNAAPGTGSNAVTSGTVTPDFNGDFIFGCMSARNPSVTLTTGTGFTSPAITGFNGGANGTEYLIQTTAATVAATATSGTAGTINALAGVMAIKAADGTPVSSGTPGRRRFQ